MRPTPRPRADAPTMSALLNEALTNPGSMMKAYSAFYTYSIGNQLLALFQCAFRGITPGPINTFPSWKALGRNVKRGERALMLCMPLSVKRRGDDGPRDVSEIDSDGDGDHFTAFVYKARWFVLSQTEGPEIELPALPTWQADLALANLGITQVPFDHPDGNCQGFARLQTIAINPVAQLPHKTLFHEAAHVTLGHTLEADFDDGDRTPKNLREVEAESVALLCCEALGLEGSEFCRGYIQNWANTETIPDQSARKILVAADKILKAGAPPKQATVH